MALGPLVVRLDVGLLMMVRAHRSSSPKVVKAAAGAFPSGHGSGPRSPVKKPVRSREQVTSRASAHGVPNSTVRLAVMIRR